MMPAALPIYTAAFLLAACYNVLWTQYSIATHARHGGRAATWAASISLVTSLQVLIYTRVESALIAQVIGAGVGAYIGIKCHCLPNRRSSTSSANSAV